VPALRDVGVELLGSGREALSILAVDQRAPIPDKQRAGLKQVAGRLVGELVARGDPHAVVDVHAAADGSPGRGDRLVLHERAVDADLAERPVGIAQEEAGDDGLRLVIGGAPLVEVTCLRE
jgi:hypothetical protein